MSLVLILLCQSRKTNRQLRPVWQDYLCSLQANRADNADQLASELSPAQGGPSAGLSFEDHGSPLKRPPKEKFHLLRFDLRFAES